MLFGIRGKVEALACHENGDGSGIVVVRGADQLITFDVGAYIPGGLRVGDELHIQVHVLNRVPRSAPGGGTERSPDAP